MIAEYSNSEIPVQLSTCDAYTGMPWVNPSKISDADGHWEAHAVM